MGPPTVMAELPVTRVQDDQIVVSVGPYIFHNSPDPCNKRSASSRGSASPPHSNLKFAGARNPASSSSRQLAGVACMAVARTFSRLLSSL